MSWGRKFTKGTIILSIVLILSFLGIGLGFAAGTIKNVVKLDDTPSMNLRQRRILWIKTVR